MLAKPREFRTSQPRGIRNPSKTGELAVASAAAAPVRARRRSQVGHGEDSDSHGSWAISYGDMITLLLTFFILYFSVDDQKGSAPKVDATLLSALTRMDIKAEERKTSFGLDGALKDKPLRVGNLDDTGIIEFEAPPVGGKVHKMGSQLILEFPDLSFFDFGKVEVNSVGERSLKQFAKLYSPFAGQNRLGIRAFTDDRPVKPEPGKRFQDNLELSALRSVATMRVLEKAGIPLGLMRLGGWGELSQTRKSLEQAKQQKEQQLDQARKPASLGKGDPFSRKVILVIEPEVVP